MVSDLVLLDFSDHLGSCFQINLDEERWIELNLLEVKSLSVSGSKWPSQREPFALLFQGPSTPVLPQQIYRLEHPQMGALEIFLVPVDQKPDGMRYEAIFS